MFQTNLQLAQHTFARSDRKIWASQTALQLYERACRRGQIRSALRRRSRRLLDLSAVEAARTVRGRRHVGARSVSLDQIRGSEGRCDDFDQDFAPLQEHNKGRWSSVAVARLMNVTLPPVELIQVGEVYFVRDGHHRVSVARALGEKEIDAVVTVWGGT
jgi:hypothetical protein